MTWTNLQECAGAETNTVPTYTQLDARRRDSIVVGDDDDKDWLTIVCTGRGSFGSRHLPFYPENWK